MSNVINLSKGKTICLTKTALSSGEALKKVKCGLSWGKIAKKEQKIEKGYTPGFFGKLFGKQATPDKVIDINVREESVDLDASICVYNSRKRLIDKVYFGHKQSKDGSIMSLGDDTTGSNKQGMDGDNETLIIDFPEVSEETKYLVVILNSYDHHKFDELPFAEMKIYDQNKEFAKFRIDNNPDLIGKEALVLGVFSRSFDGLWEFSPSGISSSERSVSEIAEGSAKSIL